MLTGRMMAFPLTITHLWQRAREFFPRQEVVSRLPDKSLHRQTYADFAARTARLANALKKLGVGPGDRVATLCWNHRQHLEAYYAVPMMGAVVHTLNIRLHPSELLYIAMNAEDSVLIVDRSLWKLYEAFGPEVRSVRHVIVVPDAGPAPEGTHDYEALLSAERDEYEWPALEENAAAMLCYTSGTTGNPKGVLLSHRSTALHAIVSCMTDTLSVSQGDTVLPVVPMFHAAAWGLPYSAVLAGAKLVMPGPHLDAVSLLDLMAAEKVTLAAGVPTIWLGILAALDNEPKRWDLRSVRAMVIGGAAAPASMIEGFSTRHALQVVHAWGMTEMSPLGTVANIKHSLRDRSPEELLSLRASQGYAVPFVETRHVNDQGSPLPRDGETFGELEVRGPWVASSYYGGDGADRFTADGWFKTGDVVTLDGEGYMRITDRAKDVIKSGGEWISSVALENALMSHPAVLEAAVFAAQHPTWSERPVAAVAFKPGQSATPDELRAHIEGRFAKFWLPDAYVVVSQIPRTSTGKFLKTKLREEHGRILLGEAAT
ncbi:MAG: long-chain fatty acid--CoA ligase [Deltaproteobacteria bacterium]|nr:long-chain fatty acid--CoA ligase [Deltaproteobacteria bacterium]